MLEAWQNEVRAKVRENASCAEEEYIEEDLRSPYAGDCRVQSLCRDWWRKAGYEIVDWTRLPRRKATLLLLDATQKIITKRPFERT